ncbi:hypothetical protein XthCFBP4691_05890 [Xanthomonas theicola]|uniref:TonB-dependent receptor plug domain-containing protein n=1 Tax=Xanthomonas theicola TaxID=56464 RepID=A0A2S6ZIM5_9XANT|nr:hypothetical protein XthCFBP4691_05890 [Xanthomonas theicola]
MEAPAQTLAGALTDLAHACGLRIPFEDGRVQGKMSNGVSGRGGEIAFDGIYGIASDDRVRTEYVERIEMVKGPGALLLGMSPNGTVGGVINIAPKRARRRGQCDHHIPATASRKGIWG